MTTPRSSTDTLIKALRILGRDIQSADGVANAVMFEAADRLYELSLHSDSLMIIVKNMEDIKEHSDDLANALTACCTAMQAINMKIIPEPEKALEAYRARFSKNN
jgi:hypothetical protein